MNVRLLAVPILIYAIGNPASAAETPKECAIRLTQAAIEKANSLDDPQTLVKTELAKLISANTTKHLEDGGTTTALLPKWDVLSPIERDELIEHLRQLAPAAGATDVMRKAVREANALAKASDGALTTAMEHPQNSPWLVEYLFFSQRSQRRRQLGQYSENNLDRWRTLQDLNPVVDKLDYEADAVLKSPVYASNDEPTSADLFSDETSAANRSLVRYLYVVQQLNKAAQSDDFDGKLHKLMEEVQGHDLDRYIDEGRVGLDGAAVARGSQTSQQILERLSVLFTKFGFDEQELKTRVDQLRRRDKLKPAQREKLEAFLAEVSSKIRRGELSLLLDSARALVADNQSRLRSLRVSARSKDKKDYIELAEEQRRALQLIAVLEKLEASATALTVRPIELDRAKPVVGSVGGSPSVHYVYNTRDDDTWFWLFYYHSMFNNCHVGHHCNALSAASYHTHYADQTLDEFHRRGLSDHLSSVPADAASLSLKDEFPSAGVFFGGGSEMDYVGMDEWKADQTLADSPEVQTAWAQEWKDPVVESYSSSWSGGSSNWSTSDDSSSGSSWTSSGTSIGSDWGSSGSGSGGSDWSSGGSTDWSSGGGSDWSSGGGSDWSSGSSDFGSSGGSDW